MGVGFCFVPELELFGLCIRKDKKITTIVSENRLTGEKETYEVLSSLVQPIKKVFSISGTTVSASANEGTSNRTGTVTIT